MKRLTVVLMALAAFMLFAAALSPLASVALAAPPTNDVFSSAQTIMGTSGSVATNNLDATKQTGEPNHAGNPGGASVWFKWTAPQSGRFTFDTTTDGTSQNWSNFDTLLGIYTGLDVASLSTVASNDDPFPTKCTGAYSYSGLCQGAVVATDVTAGTTYFIAVDGYDGATGSITFAWSPTPANDDFPGATLTGAFGADVRSDLGATRQADDPFTAQTANGFSWRTLWYSWTAPVSGDVTFNAYVPNGAVMGIYTGNAITSLTPVFEGSSYNSLKPTVAVTQGVTYRIALSDHYPIPGDFSLRWGNDDFGDAFALSGPSGSETYTNVGSTNEASEPLHAGASGGRSIWYRWTAPVNGTFTFSTSGSEFDTLLGIYTGFAEATVGNLTSVGNNDDAPGAGTTSAVTFSATAGKTYFVAVDGKAAATGHVTLSWDVGPPANRATELSPSSITVQAGTIQTGSAASLAADDKSYLVIKSTAKGTRAAAWYGTFTGVDNGASTLQAIYKGKSTLACTQVVSIWRWSDSTWDQLDSRSIGTSEVEVANLSPLGPLADYVSGTSGTGDVRVRIGCSNPTRPFKLSSGLLKLVVTT